MTFHTCTPLFTFASPPPIPDLASFPQSTVPLGFSCHMGMFIFISTHILHVGEDMQYLMPSPTLPPTVPHFLSLSLSFYNPLQFMLCEYLNLGPEYERERGVHLHLFESGLFPLT